MNIVKAALMAAVLTTSTFAQQAGTQPVSNSCPPNVLPETPTQWHGSALHQAVMDHDLKLVNQLLAQGASPDERDNGGNPPLITALTPGRRLQPHGVIPEEAHAASIADENRAQVAMASALISHNADVNAQTRIGITPLMQLIMGGYGVTADLRLARLMIDHHADLNLRDSFGDTALLLALQLGKLDLARLLAHSGADPNIANCRQETALKAALSTHDVAMVRLLQSQKR